MDRDEKVSETADTVSQPLTKEELYKAIDTVLATATSDSVFHKRAYDSIVRLIEVSELCSPPVDSSFEKYRIVTGKDKEDA